MTTFADKFIPEGPPGEKKPMTKKVFDWLDMPEEIHKELQKWTVEALGLSNDCYFSWTVGGDEADIALDDSCQHYSIRRMA